MSPPPVTTSDAEGADAPTPEPSMPTERTTVATAGAAAAPSGSAAEEDEKAHSNEPERVVEAGGPSGRYGRVPRAWRGVIRRR